MKKNANQVCFILLIVLALLFPVLAGTELRAETVYLKNGQILSGRIVSQSRRSIHIAANGRVRTIPKNKIRRIDYTNAAKVVTSRSRNDAQQKKAEARRLSLLRKQSFQQAFGRYPPFEPSLALHLDPKQYQKQTPERESSRRSGKQNENSSRMDALWRSALLPGWGQYEQGHPYKAAGFAAGFGIGLAAFYNATLLYNGAVNDLANMGGGALGSLQIPAVISSGDPVAVYLYQRPFVEQQANVDRKYDRVQQAGYFTLAIYLWNLADVWFFGAHPKQALQDRSSAKTHAWSLELRPSSRLSGGTQLRSGLPSRQPQRSFAASELELRFRVFY